MTKLWNKNHHNVQTVDYQPFTKCDECEVFKATLKHMKTTEDKEILKAKQQVHNQMVSLKIQETK
jgi:hypothetical protein